MSAAHPVLPETAPFPREHIQALNAVMAHSNVEQRAWLSGFLAGYQSSGAVAPATGARPKVPLTILYATESGNTEGLAELAAQAARKQGFQPKVVDMADSQPSDLADVRNLMVIASTWGEGDPPERAQDFYHGLMADDAPRLADTNFSVLALGDSSYVNFCEIGRRIDTRLAELGAQRAADRVDCDLDFDELAETWTTATLGALKEKAAPDDAVVTGEVIPFGPATAPGWSRTNPFAAEITKSVNLNGSRSAKETLHVELSLEGSGLTYEPGDAIGIVPENDPAVVEAVMAAGRLDGDDLADRLRREFDITTLTRPVIEAYAEASGRDDVRALLADDAWLRYADGRQIVDLLENYPADLSPDTFPGLLRKLAPRLYSVASSPLAYPDEAHLLIGVVDYETHGRRRFGVASQFAKARNASASLSVYTKANKGFRLPADGDRPVIMIGPGTGVAPFRGFLQHREAQGAGGRNWLFFGDRSYTHDFLYQLDWQAFRKAGVLSEIDVAFSRDQPEKVYVQNRMWERRDALWSWLEDGAHVYVCGDEKAMAKDVDAMLRRIVGTVGGRDADAADAYVDDLRRAGRYQRDVY